MIGLKVIKKDIEFQMATTVKTHKNMKEAICGLICQFFIMEAIEESLVDEQDVAI